MVHKLNNLSVQNVLLILTLSISGLALAQTTSSKIDKLLSEFEAKNEFNGAVLVAEKGIIILKKGYGYADFENRIKNTSETKFSIGSTTKSFTACAVMQQVEKEKLELHIPISTYIPALKEELGKLTLHQLMKNTSGLPVHLNRLTTLEYKDISSKEIIDIYNDKATLSIGPGSDYSYSNINYQLASIVLEKVTGISYKAYLEENTFIPFEMLNSGVERTYDFPKDKARGYIVEDENIKKAKRNFMAYAKGGGDIYATVGDLYKWDQALYGNQYVSEKSKELLFDGTPEEYGGYGYGFKIKPYTRNSSNKPHGKLVRHGGSMYGYISNVHRYLDDNVTIIVLGNIRPYPIMEITVAIEKIVFNIEDF